METRLPTLYSRTSVGKVQEWTIIVNGDSFYTESGQTDGKKVLSKPTVCKGKNVGKANATTDDEQALSEAQAKWDKKAKTGYTVNIDLIDKCIAYIDPILAKDYKDYKDKFDWSKGWLVQNKYNGVRCTAQLENGRVVLRSRKGEEWKTVPHINRDLEAFFKEYPHAFLDGELYNYELRKTLNELTSLVRKSSEDELTPELFAQTEKIVFFYVYDGAFFGPGFEPKDSYTDRKKWIDDNLPKLSKTYRYVQTWEVTSEAEMTVLYNGFLEDGEEGAIIRNPKMPYEFGKRTKDLLKYKPVDTDDCLILKMMEGTGNYAGVAKIALVRWKGMEFNATIIGPQPLGRKILKEKVKWENRVAEFLYNGLTGLGTPNYARIDPENCFKGDR